MAESRVLRALNKMFLKEAGGSERPAFHDVDTTWPALRVFDRNWEAIRREVEGVLPNQAGIPRYHEISKAETYISGTVNPEKNWRVFMLESMAGGTAGNQAKCPQTTALIKEVPNVVQAFFSILDAGKSIPAHDGYYLGYLRYHLGLKVPKNNPPQIRVKDTVYTWKEGESVMFDDSWNHEVMNQSDEIRVVLIVDVLRPMGFLAHAANWLVTRVLARHTEEAAQVRAALKKFA